MKAKYKECQETLKEWIKNRDRSECWEWPFAKVDKNPKRQYGAATYQSKAIGAHRLALIFEGIDVSGKLVCHKCDNPPCVNPDHLFVGTYQDNENDKWAKGRGLRGTEQTMHKLNDRLVLEIREKAALGYSQRRLAREYGVGKTTIANVIHRKAWSHV